MADQDPESSHFIWSIDEAESQQVKQIGVSACGATAVINVLKALGIEHDAQGVAAKIKTRRRAETAPLHDYLFSRSVAGTSADDLIEGLSEIAGDKVYARFFYFYPKRDVDVAEWLLSWMKQGVVPLATLNLQRGIEPGTEVPDAWHHQMVYGADKEHIHMCNPVTATEWGTIEEQLCSDAVLKVRIVDVLTRLDTRCDVQAIESHPDVRWSKMKVKDQILRVLREQLTTTDSEDQQQQMGRLLHNHVTVPAVYKSGMMMCVRTDQTNAYKNLRSASDLPIL